VAGETLIARTAGQIEVGDDTTPDEPLVHLRPSFGDDPGQLMTRHSGQESQIVPQIAPDRVEDCETDAARFDLDHDLIGTGLGKVETLPNRLPTPGVNPITRLSAGGHEASPGRVRLAAQPPDQGDDRWDPHFTSLTAGTSTGKTMSMS
jgi:hypothetical protein